MGVYNKTRFERRSLNKNKKGCEAFIYTALIIILTLGVLTGSIMAVNAGNLNGQAPDIGNFFQRDNFNKSQAFRESFFKYIKIVIILWLCTFVSFGGIISSIVIFVKSMGIGFVSCLTVMEFGVKGVYYSLFLYTIQNAVIFAVFLLITKESFMPFADSINRGLKFKSPVYAPLGLAEKAVLLIISAVVVFLTAFYEVNICPLIMG